ncbi:MAG: zinc metalloprotease HtpX [Deltaproteobacteria bacterium]|nr:zinc metalloprotease HtpX [Deltaproteobacteria bacterium]MDZ4343479.1 zinc metalloprotease HtpX [Candidatus Binatia bacterium]
MNTLKTTFLMAFLTVLLVIAGGALGGQGGMVTAFLFAVVMNGVSYWFSDKIVLRMYGAKEIASDDLPELHRIVKDLTLRAKMPMPKLYLVPQEAPNAFATGRDESHAAVAVTQGILDILTEAELRGVLAHELSHVKNRDMLIGTIAATMAGAISMLAYIAQWGLIFGGRGGDQREGGNPIAALAMIILAPLAALLVQMAISRSREFGADATGAVISGDPLSLANALKKLQRGVEKIPMEANPATAHMFIVSPLTGGGLMTLFSTHPPLEERIRRLETMAGGKR